MAVYRKKLVDKDGNTIIPAVGDVYGTVYTATLSTATAGDTARYDFTPDTPIENNKVYAVMFPEPTVNNATVILGDGVVSGSILVPPVSATDSPNYELLTTDMINNTEPLLLMYSGVQWVCLNQKKKVATADLEDKSVKSNKIDWTTSIRTARMPGTSSTTPTSAWKEFNLGSSATVTGLIPGKTYLVRTSSDWTEGKGEFRTNIKAGTTSLSMRPYNSNGALTAVSYEDVITIPSGVTTATIQRAYSGEKVGVRIGATRVTFQIID